LVVGLVLETDDMGTIVATVTYAAVLVVVFGTVVRDMELEVVDGGWDRCVCMVSALLAKGKRRYSR
jgi:hypothetical protein